MPTGGEHERGRYALAVSSGPLAVALADIVWERENPDGTEPGAPLSWVAESLV